MNTLRTHDLKIWPQFFNDVASGDKTFEVRVNDRAFQVGDTIHLREWDPQVKMYTGRACHVRIRYMMDSSAWYMIPNHLAIFSIELLEAHAK